MIRFGLSILIITVGSVTMPTDMSFVVWYCGLSTKSFQHLLSVYSILWSEHVVLAEGVGTLRY